MRVTLHGIGGSGSGRKRTFARDYRERKWSDGALADDSGRQTGLVNSVARLVNRPANRQCADHPLCKHTAVLAVCLGFISTDYEQCGRLLAILARHDLLVFCISVASIRLPACLITSDLNKSVSCLPMTCDSCH